MLNHNIISVIIPALNEEKSLPSLLHAIPAYVDHILVVDNGSTDKTAEVASAYGAQVISEPIRGYGKACLTGIAALSAETNIVVFLDADFCDDPAHIKTLCSLIIDEGADFVLASRMHSEAKQHLTIPQRFGNQLASFLMNVIWRSDYTDLGPFRAIRKSALHSLNMQDVDFGWTVEMQINAVINKLTIKEIDLPYRTRLFGKSKVSGTVSGVWNAGTKILYVIAINYLRNLSKKNRSELGANSLRNSGKT